ncbi:unnamed protein product [Euphydryas editha]|uniref:Uncharacterized protein n=1 Tax=Euphydryas editha TaxID=104508 RepID=A0AAU9TIU3_EUPED|nr:unnamed protein product [Euphydryas editha]
MISGYRSSWAPTTLSTQLILRNSGYLTHYRNIALHESSIVWLSSSIRVTKWCPKKKRKQDRDHTRWEDEFKLTARSNWRRVAQDRQVPLFFIVREGFSMDVKHRDCL